MRDIFKVGDRVFCRLTAEVAPERNPFGVITTLNNDCYLVNFDGGNYSSCIRDGDELVLESVYNSPLMRALNE